VLQAKKTKKVPILFLSPLVPFIEDERRRKKGAGLLSRKL